MSDVTLTGYLHPGYAQSLAEFGTPRVLPLSGGSILDRRIHRSPYRDAMGAYPLFCCSDWSKLHLDFAPLADEFVSLSLVSDPFGGCSVEYLERTFDVVSPFKQHFVSDLGEPMRSFVSDHKRRHAMKALKALAIERCDNPALFLDAWVELYEHVKDKHNVAGVRAFSRVAFEQQLSLPGLVMFRACCGDTTVGIHLWFLQGDVAYWHLGATNEDGYRLMASYGLLWYALEHLQGRVRWADLGSAPGLSEGDDSGLRTFKNAWATGTRTAYFCGKILQSERYRQLTGAGGVSLAEYFPAYRAQEYEA